MIEQAFTDLILRHNRSPLGRARIEFPSFTARGANPLCGDELTLDGLIIDGQLVALGYEIEASALTLASTSIMVELSQGHSVNDVRVLCRATLGYLAGENTAPRSELEAFASVLGYRNRLKTLTLPWATLHGALEGRLETTTEIALKGESL